MTIRDSLAQVQELLGRATFGVLRADAHKDWFQPTVMLHSGDDIVARYHHGAPDFTCTVGKYEYELRNAEAVEACVNFFMQHGPELMKTLDRHGAGDAEDSARLDWLCTGNRKRVEDTITTGWFRVYHDVAPMSADHAEWRAMTEEFYPTTREAIDAARAGERGVS